MAAAGQAEMEHARQTAALGMANLQASEIALEKARNDKVKQFAMFERDEQATIAEILKSMNPSLPSTLDPKMAEMVQKLKGMQAGPTFDKEYVTGQVQSHQMLLKVQEDYLASGRNREHVNVTKLARGMIKEHLALLADLQKAMG